MCDEIDFEKIMHQNQWEIVGKIACCSSKLCQANKINHWKNVFGNPQQLRDLALMKGPISFFQEQNKHGLCQSWTVRMKLIKLYYIMHITLKSPMYIKYINIHVHQVFSWLHTVFFLCSSCLAVIWRPVNPPVCVPGNCFTTGSHGENSLPLYLWSQQRWTQNLPQQREEGANPLHFSLILTTFQKPLQRNCFTSEKHIYFQASCCNQLYERIYIIALSLKAQCWRQKEWRRKQHDWIYSCET